MKEGQMENKDNKMIELASVSDDKLKAMAFDNLVNIEARQNTQAILLQEIRKRENAKRVVDTIDETTTPVVKE